ALLVLDGAPGCPVVWAANCVGRGSAPGSERSGERRQIRLRSLPGRACPDPGPRSRRERSDAALRSRDAGSEPILGVKKGSGGGEPPAGAQRSSTPNEDVRRRPTLPHPPECSTIGAIELSFRVRNGTGRFLDAMTAVTQRDSQPAPNTPPTPERDGQRGG